MLEKQIEWIKIIQKIRNPFFDDLFIFINFFDTIYFWFLAILIIWAFVGWRVGLKTFYLLSLSSFVNVILKVVFMQPRPFHLVESLKVIYVGEFGFPSGAAQNFMILSLLLIYHFRGRISNFVLYPFVATFFLVFSFSRIYLGVHFFTDVFAGWVVGISLFLFYVYAFPKIFGCLLKSAAIPLFTSDKKVFFILKRNGVIPLFLYLSLLCIVGLFFYNISKVWMLYFVVLGITIGTLLSKNFGLFVDDRSLMAKCLRLLLFLLGSCVLYLIFTQEHIVLFAFLVGIWISFGNYLLYGRGVKIIKK